MTTRNYPIILFRYIAKELLAFASGCLLAFIGILLAMNLLKFASLIVAKGVAFSQIATVFISLIPTFLEIAIPMSMLLGVMMCFARLSGDSEIIVTRASGISVGMLTIPVIGIALAVTILGFAVSFIGRPWGYNTLNETLVSIASESSTASLEEGVFSALGDLTLYAEKLEHSTGKMSRIMLDDRRDKDDRKIVFAKLGMIATDPETKKLYISLTDGQIHQQTVKGYAVTKFEENISVIEPQELFGSDQEKKGKQFSAMNTAELNTIQNAYEELLALNKKDLLNQKHPEDIIVLPFGQKIFPHQKNGREFKKRINRVKIEYGRRYSMPFAAFALALIGMTLGIQPPRTQRAYGMGFSLMLGIGVFIIYYGVLSVCIAMAESNTISPFFALWFPNFLVLAIAAYTLYRLSNESWQSIPDVIQGKVGGKINVVFFKLLRLFKPKPEITT